MLRTVDSPLVHGSCRGATIRYSGFCDFPLPRVNWPQSHMFTVKPIQFAPIFTSSRTQLRSFLTHSALQTFRKSVKQSQLHTIRSARSRHSALSDSPRGSLKLVRSPRRNAGSAASSQASALQSDLALNERVPVHRLKATQNHRAWRLAQSQRNCYVSRNVRNYVRISVVIYFC